MRSALTMLIAVCAAVCSLAWATDGFSALTSEQARRISISRQPVAVPDATLRMADGSQKSLRDLLINPSGSSIVGFFYSRCNSICVTMGNDLRKLQQLITDKGLEGKVQLLSISFDAHNDNTQVLSAYGDRMQARDTIWQIAAAEQGESLAVVLDTFGIRVIDDGKGGFVHNSAYHVVGARGDLEAIVDLANPMRALSIANGELK